MYNYVSEKIIKMKNSLLVIFDKILCAQNIGATLKIHKKSNFDQNQLKLSTQHMYMYMYQKKL